MLYPNGPWLKRTIQHWRPAILPYDELIEAIPAGSSVLDIGCGGGLFLGLLWSRGRITAGMGIDSSAQAISVAQEMAARLNAPLTFECVDARTHGPDDAYDVVSLIDLLHRVPLIAHEQVVRDALSRVLPGGRFLYKDMCDAPFWKAAANRLHDLVLAQDWIHYAAIEQVVSWCEEDGFRLVKREDISRLWYGHELAVFQRNT